METVVVAILKTGEAFIIGTGETDAACPSACDWHTSNSDVERAVGAVRRLPEAGSKAVAPAGA